MFCSTIIPTIGRMTLERAVQSVLNQEFIADDFEVIVVNDSGQLLPPANWQHSPRVRMIETQRRERSVARNTGAAMARGRYLHFLDDDDWLLPGAFNAFANLARENPNMGWLFGACEYVDMNNRSLSIFRFSSGGNIFVRVMSQAQWVQLQSSLVRTDAFFAIGGFNPLLKVTQDIDLCRHIALRYDVAEMPTVVARILRGTGWRTTTDYPSMFEYYRLGRETVLNEPGVWTRLHTSECKGYWRGRIVRILVASASWNLKRKRWWTSVSRVVYALVSFAIANRNFVDVDFWRGIVARPTSNVQLN
jgi:glycosyltransferase involved in cell wall biosynthesis